MHEESYLHPLPLPLFYWCSASVSRRAPNPPRWNAAFCDGHVQFISNTISQLTWVLLQSTNDGQVPGNDY